MKAVIRLGDWWLDGVFTALFFNRVGGTGKSDYVVSARKHPKAITRSDSRVKIKPSAVGKGHLDSKILCWS